MTALEQQFVVHLYAPAHLSDSLAAVREIWTGCQEAFGTTGPVLGLPTEPPHALSGFPAAAELPLCAAERPDASCQVVLRLHHDTLNLSLALTGPEGDWRSWDARWQALVESRAAHLLGEARLCLASTGDPRLELLNPLLPEPADAWCRPVATPDGLLLWETDQSADDRRLRRFLLAFAPDDDPVASSFAWSRGTPEIPPFARYLLHAAKLRYELRVWLRDGGGRPASHAPTRNDALRRRADLQDMRRTVDIAADNLRRSLDLSGLLLQAGPFADDAAVAKAFLERLDDDLGYLDTAIERAEIQDGLNDSGDLPAPAGSRDVFVVYGRDREARDAVFTFLRALDLRPLEWEPLVARSGSAAPYIGEVVGLSLPRATAVVVLMTPDDVVHLHPDLGSEQPSAQCRPNVLIELGMALAANPAGTLLLRFGDQRPITDLDGRHYIPVTGDSKFRLRFAQRLKLAGCPVDLSGGDWLTAGDFDSLKAHRRGPDLQRP